MNIKALDFEKFIIDKNIDFIDFGCSKGGSITFAKKRFGGINGLGIDINAHKIQMAIEAGHNAIVFNIHDIPNSKIVNFVIMSHFLEHVSNLEDVKAFIRKACEISKDFVYIQQPFFDSDCYLFERGFKLFWSDWKGHPNHMTSFTLWLILKELKKEGFPIEFSLHAYKKIIDSKDSCILLTSTDTDQNFYNPDYHPKKSESVVFDGNVFHELICLITFNGNSHDAMLKKMRYDYTIINHLGNLVKSPFQ